MPPTARRPSATPHTPTTPAASDKMTTSDKIADDDEDEPAWLTAAEQECGGSPAATGSPIAATSTTSPPVDEGTRILQLQAQLEAATTALEEHNKQTEQRLAEQETQLREEAAATAAQAVEVVRNQMEERLFEKVAESERARIELQQAREIISERDASIALMREELDERREAMNRLHAACSSQAAAAASAAACSQPGSGGSSQQQATVLPSTPTGAAAGAAVAFDPTGVCGCRTDIRPQQQVRTAGLGTSASSAATATGGKGSTQAEEMARMNAIANDELQRRMSLAKVERDLMQSINREAEARDSHKEECSGYEEEIRRGHAREALLKQEVKRLEEGMASLGGVSSVLQKTVVDLDQSEARVEELRKEVEVSGVAMRSAQEAAAVADERSEEALSQARTERSGRQRAEEALAAAVRREEAAEEARAAALASSEELVGGTKEGAQALCEAVDALHRWIDGVMLHNASSSATTLEAIQAIVKGAHAGPLLRGAHGTLEAFATRLQYVCDEVLRMRQQVIKLQDEKDRGERDVQAAESRCHQMRLRGEKLEEAALEEERARRAQQSENVAREVAREAERVREAAVARAAEVEGSLEPRRQLACAMAVQLSDALRRSGAVSTEAPMLLDASCSSHTWEVISPALAALVSHVCYYWNAQQKELSEALGQLELARKRLREKEESLTRAALIAVGMKATSSPQAQGPAVKGHQPCLSGGGSGPAAQQRRAALAEGRGGSGRDFISYDSGAL